MQLFFSREQRVLGARNAPPDPLHPRNPRPNFELRCLNASAVFCILSSLPFLTTHQPRALRRIHDRLRCALDAKPLRVHAQVIVLVRLP